eukprot:c20022_g1_i1.p1 GENE.c20022_g1_i1~~c20022_g1_i1.p1  ORF type:complete len:509 (+),score=165.38 c20022_g1_i1:58-1584(+)
MSAEEFVITSKFVPPEQILATEISIQLFLKDFISSVPIATQTELEDMEIILKRVLVDDNGSKLLTTSLEGKTLLTYIIEATKDTENTQVRIASVAVLRAISGTVHGVQNMVSHPSVFEALILGLKDSTDAVWFSCKECLIQLSKNENGAKEFFSLSLQKILRDTANSSTHVSIRVFETILGMASRSETALEQLKKTNWFQLLANCIKNEEDVLIRLNSIELVMEIARANRSSQPYADQLLLSLFKNYNLTAIVSQIIKASHSDEIDPSDPYISFVIPQILLLTGAVAVSCPPNSELAESLNSAGIIDSALILMTSSSDPQVIEGSLCCLGGLVMHSNNSEPFSTEKFRNCFAKHFFAANESVKIAAAGTLARFILSPIEETGFQLYEYLASYSKSPTLDYLIRASKLENYQITDSVYSIISSILKSKEGLKIITATDNGQKLVNWLIDRNTDSRKIGKEVKFSFVKELNSHKDHTICLASNYQSELKVFLIHGPYRQVAEPEVATEQF